MFVQLLPACIRSGQLHKRKNRQANADAKMLRRTGLDERLALDAVRELSAEPDVVRTLPPGAFASWNRLKCLKAIPPASR
jgi:hypothetical protein